MNWKPEDPIDKNREHDPTAMRYKGEKGEKGDKGAQGNQGNRGPGIELLEKRINLLVRGYFVLFVCFALSIGILVHTLNKVNTEQRVQNAYAAHTRMVQKSGEPTGVCLREAMKAGEPVIFAIENDLKLGLDSPQINNSFAKPFFAEILRLFEKVKQPLGEYVKLQEKRYTEVRCPDVAQFDK